jgi:hypothetical protein
MKKSAFIVLVSLAVMFTGCAGNMKTSEVSKFENYRAVKKIAFLPASADKGFVAERMNKINSEVMEPAAKEGYTVVSVDQVKKLLGKNFNALEKDPMNKRLLRQVVRKFGVEAFIVCEVNEWQADAAVPDKAGYYLNKAALTYTSYDAKTFKPISKISGSNESVDALSEDSVINRLAKELAVKLIRSL